MKRIVFMLTALLISTSLVQAQRKPKNVKGLEGTRVRAVELKLTGYEMSSALSEDGMSLINVAYKWYAGISQADDKQLAIEIAQREAYATISRTIENAVHDKAERGKVANNGQVLQAVKSHWEQISTSLQNGCEPFGSVQIEYNKKTKMYEVTAKVAIRGDKYSKLMKQAKEEIPEGLSDTDLHDFIEINNSIVDAAKGE